MDGKDEGVYAWIMANYLLGTIKASTPPDRPMYAVRSRPGWRFYTNRVRVYVQSSDMQLEEGEHKYDLQFGGRSNVLYQHSYLGYGLMRVRRHVHRLVNFMSTLQATKPKEVVGNPCLAKSTWRVVTVKGEATGVERKVTMGVGDIGSFEACDRVVQLILAKDAYLRFSSFFSLLLSSFISLFYPSFLLFSPFPSSSLHLSHPSPFLFPCPCHFFPFSLLIHMHAQNM